MKSSSPGKRHSLFEHFRASKMFGKADIIFAAVLLAAAVVAMVFAFGAKPPGNIAEVYIEGKLAAAYSLDQQKTVSFDVGIELHIDNGKAAVTKSDCPDHLCEYFGYISKAGERIVCAPNKFVVVIKGDPEYDAVTGRRQA